MWIGEGGDESTDGIESCRENFLNSLENFDRARLIGSIKVDGRDVK